MPIRVDLPAPFSPTMPWMEPARTVSDTARLACTSPNHLSTPRRSRIGEAPACRVPAGWPSCPTAISRSFRRAVRPLEPATHAHLAEHGHRDGEMAIAGRTPPALSFELAEAQVAQS